MIHGISRSKIAAGASGARRILPYSYIDGIAVAFDLILILASSLLTGIFYHLAFLGWGGDIETFFGIGALTAVNFLAILAARRAYKPQDLANFWKQARETTTTWLFVFFVLSAVAFSLKISETYSRGATLTFFVFGWAAIILWRLIIARFMAHAFAKGGFAERKTILLAEQGLLAGSSIVEDLKRYGYMPVRTFEFASNSVALEAASCAPPVSLNEIIEVCQQLPIECVFVLGSWYNQLSIDKVLDGAGRRVRADLPLARSKCGAFPR